MKLSTAILFVVLFFGILTFLKQEEKARQTEETQAKIAETTAIMEKILSSEENYKSFLKGEPKMLDAWGTPIILYANDHKTLKDQSHIIDRIIIKSAGPDMMWNTEDDISYSVSNINWKNAGKRTGKVSTEFLRGLLEGVKDSATEKK